MGMFYCEDCDRDRDSKNDGYNECDDDYICDSCLGNRQDEDERERSAWRDKQNNTPEYQAWKTKREQELL